MRIKLAETFHLMVGGMQQRKLSLHELYYSDSQTILNTVSRVLWNFVTDIGHQTSTPGAPNLRSRPQPVSREGFLKNSRITKKKSKFVSKFKQ
jgi:hypothetical protein